MFRVTIGIVVLLALTAALWSDDPKDKSKNDQPSAAAQKYLALVKEYDNANRHYLAASQQAKNDNDRKKAQELKAERDKVVGKLLDLAKECPDDPAAVDALIWVATFDASLKEAGTALEALKKDHLDDPKLGPICQVLGNQDSPKATAFLHDVFDQSKDHPAQGRAGYALGLQAKRLAEVASEEDEEKANRLAKEAEDLFERVAKNFRDVKVGKGTLSDRADIELFGLRQLAIGATAPDIEGEDTEGAKMKLSDFKGKVVLLEFWAHW